MGWFWDNPRELEAGSVTAEGAGPLLGAKVQDSTWPRFPKAGFLSSVSALLAGPNGKPVRVVVAGGGCLQGPSQHLSRWKAGLELRDSTRRTCHRPPLGCSLSLQPSYACVCLQ